METKAIEQRLGFVHDCESGQWTMAELCERYRVSRPTGYKGLQRFREKGELGLLELSRGPNRCPHRTPTRVETLILDARREYGWGARKLRQVLAKRHPSLRWPALSTINEILGRHDLLRRRRGRRRWDHPGSVALPSERPNQIWPADFKGQFKTRDGRYCYPLTVTDHFSRCLLLCQGLRSVKAEDAKPAFRRLFREVGLPEAIRTDNGAPFASHAIQGLSPLNVWWMKLGIVHQRIHPSSPQEIGSHERMHRELKRETVWPAATNLRSQQARFDRFRARYNEERPHEGIANEVPASRWRPSLRPYPERITTPDYPSHMEVSRVNTAGNFQLRGNPHFLTHALCGEYVGLESVGEGLWNIVFYKTLIGRIDQQTGIVSSATEYAYEV